MSVEEPSNEIVSEKIPTLIGINHNTGDLVLSLRNDRDANQVDAEFRVHRDFICLHSPVLRYLVSDADFVDGCPAIPCYGDSAEDFRALLTALYNGLAILQDKKLLTLDAALATLRLTYKYQIDGLHRGIIRILLESWPLNYDDYVIRQKQLGSPGFRVLDSMKLIKSAQQCKAWELLPAAFYEVAASRQEDWSDMERSSSEEYLTQQDLSRMLKGRERAVKRLRPLVQWGWERKEPIFAPPLAWNPDNSVGPATLLDRGQKMRLRACIHGEEYCDDGYFCHNVEATLMRTISAQLMDGKSPLAVLAEIRPEDFEAAKVCTSCVDWVFRCVLENKKMELWHNIPVDFELPNVDTEWYSERMFRTL